MEMTFLALRAKAVTFAKENFGAICVFLFLFVAGNAAGIRIAQGMGREAIGGLIEALPALLRTQGVPWLALICIALLTHALCASLLFLAGLWLPAAPLFLLGVLLRGIYMGVAIGAAFAAWPGAASICLLLLIQVETAVLLPPFVRLSVLTERRIAATLKKGLRIPAVAEDLSAFTRDALRASAGLLACALAQAVLTPAVFALFL